MKHCTIALFALAALAGAGALQAQDTATAATVSGNNTAVVIKRTNTASASGYQLVCVPVKPFDISGSASTTALKLSDVLPPGTYPEGCKALIDPKAGDEMEGESASTAVYTISTNDAGVKVWKQGNTEKNPDLKLGQVVWFFNPNDIPQQQASAEGASALAAMLGIRAQAGEEGTGGAGGDIEEETPTNIIFCGEKNQTQETVADNTQAHTTLQKIGNETSEDKTLEELIGSTGVTQGAQVHHLVGKGDKNYTIYMYRGATTGWYSYPTGGGAPSKVELANITLKPGEAVFFYAGKGAQ